MKQPAIFNPAVEQQAARSKWLPVRDKVWASSAGAIGGSVVSLLLLAQPLAELTVDAMCAFASCPSPGAMQNLATVYTVALSALGAFAGGYIKAERTGSSSPPVPE